jgi:DNA-binding transcriptional MerR regulator
MPELEQEQVLHIGELAARTGRSVHAIRWYEQQGLIPGVRRDAGGRRVYSPLHLGWLSLMDRLRRTGMSVAQMREYTALVKQGRATLKQRQEMLREHRARVQATIAEWNEALAMLDGKIDFYGEWIASGKRPPLENDPVAARRGKSPARKKTARPRH